MLESNGSDISRLDLLFASEDARVDCKVLVFLERVLMVLIVETQLKNLKAEKTGSKALLRSVC